MLPNLGVFVISTHAAQPCMRRAGTKASVRKGCRPAMKAAEWTVRQTSQGTRSCFTTRDGSASLEATRAVTRKKPSFSMMFRRRPRRRLAKSVEMPQSKKLKRLYLLISLRMSLSSQK